VIAALVHSYPYIGFPRAVTAIRAVKTSGGQLSITEMTLDPHRLVPPHIHAAEDEYTYVAAGTVGVRVADAEFEAAQGSYLIKLRGVTHAFWNPADEPARTVEIIVPAGFEAFFAELAQASAAGDAPASPATTGRPGGQVPAQLPGRTDT
jgi:quercetin dioxygenase-like cupin family protein